MGDAHRRRRRGAGLVAASLSSTYALALGAAVVSGIGVGAFHPEAARYTNLIAGNRPGTAIGVFALGGNLGFFLGPALTTPLVLLLGLDGVILVAAVPIVSAALLAAQLARLRRAQLGVAGPPQPGTGRGHDAQQWLAFGRLTVIIALRSFTFFALQILVGAYYVEQFGASLAAGNVALEIVLAAAAAGTLLGGPVGDRVGARPAISASLALAAALSMGFLLTAQPVATLLLAGSAACLISGLSVCVVLGQDYLPRRAGLASGITVGVAVGVGSLGAGFLSVLAERTDVRTALLIAALAPLLGALLAARLPSASGERRSAEAS